MLVAACNPKQELLAPRQPGVISPAPMWPTPPRPTPSTPALGRLEESSISSNGNNTESLWNWQALFHKRCALANTFSQRNDADRRNLQTNDRADLDLPETRGELAAAPATPSTRWSPLIRRRPASSTSARCT